MGDGLFTAYFSEPNWQKAHDLLLPEFNAAGIRKYHGAMLEISSQLIARWDACVGQQPVDASTDLHKLSLDTVALAGFGARLDSFGYEGAGPFEQCVDAATAAAETGGGTPEFDKQMKYLARRPRPDDRATSGRVR